MNKHYKPKNCWLVVSIHVVDEGYDVGWIVTHVMDEGYHDGRIVTAWVDEGHDAESRELEIIHMKKNQYYC